MKEKYASHIFAVVAFVVFIVLGLASASAPPPQIEERKAFWLKPENNRFKIDRSMIARNAQIKEQSFLFCDAGFEVKDKVFSSYKGSMGIDIIALPIDSERIWARYLKNAEMEITFTSQNRSVLSVLGGQNNLQAPSLEAGQFYWLLSAPWVVSGYRQVSFLLLPLNEEGIRIFTENMWNNEKQNATLFPQSSKDEWNSYEEYHEFVTQLWEVRMEEARKLF